MTFIKRTYNESTVSEDRYVAMFKDLGFTAKKVVISFTNGCSAYITIDVNVLNEGKMPMDIFVYEGIAQLKVRVSDHNSNLETICGGCVGDKVSMTLFRKLAENNVIADYKN